MPVSYTHLDVYKRQGLVRAEENQEGRREETNDFLARRILLRRHSPSTTASFQGGRFISLPWMRAVSYTHLDVYKRQVFLH